jgi:hypothetical protein
MRGRKLGFWVGVSIIGWPIAQAVRVSGPQGGSAGIPRFETWLTAGIALGNY